jgi:hypothetical protein
MYVFCYSFPKEWIISRTTFLNRRHMVGNKSLVWLLIKFINPTHVVLMEIEYGHRCKARTKGWLLSPVRLSVLRGWACFLVE